jgi:hypothetical protein
MRPTKVFFERTKSLPGYNNRKAGIEIELEKGDSAKEALIRAEKFVSEALNEAPTPQQMEIALEIVNRGKSLEELF